MKKTGDLLHQDSQFSSIYDLDEFVMSSGISGMFDNDKELARLALAKVCVDRNRKRSPALFDGLLDMEKR